MSRARYLLAALRLPPPSAPFVLRVHHVASPPITTCDVLICRRTSRNRCAGLFQVPDFLSRTRADILAVTVGNVHGRYAKKNPRLDIVRLGHVQAAASGASRSPLLRVFPAQVDGKYKSNDTLLAIHGASGLPSLQVQASISHGVCKFNVNTEVRTAAVDFFEATGSPAPGGEQSKGRLDLLSMLDGSVACMRAAIEHKMLEFDPR